MHPIDRIATENIVALSEIHEACNFKVQCDDYFDAVCEWYPIKEWRQAPSRCQDCTEESRNVFRTYGS